MKNEHEDLVKSILAKIPRPNYAELPILYNELDEMTLRIGKILATSNLFDKDTLLVRFDKATKTDIETMIKRNPHVMIPFFMMICGFSVRELDRLYGLKNVYSLRREIDQDKLDKFIEAVMENLKHPLHMETVLYKFYKNWEEHQKRHYRGKKIEKEIINILNKCGIPAGKIKITCNNKTREIDCAIPPDPDNLKVAIQIRTGVRMDLIKRAKEFSSELDEIIECRPDTKFVVVYYTPRHEAERGDEIKERIEEERRGKRPYDLVIVASNTKKIIEELIEYLAKTKIHKADTTRECNIP
ncbi:MAG: hypothetical protein F7C38_02790 [Desulfurococcales archaeon]|nr:hypothetical protein [Desulfurococcales archaeon]